MKRRGLPLSDFGLIDRHAAKRHCSGAAPPDAAADILAECKGLTAAQARGIVRHATTGLCAWRNSAAALSHLARTRGGGDLIAIVAPGAGAVWSLKYAWTSLVRAQINEYETAEKTFSSETIAQTDMNELVLGECLAPGNHQSCALQTRPS